MHSGNSEIVCFWVVQNEDQCTVEQMMRDFKKHNSRWNCVRAVMADKDFVERNVLVQELPGISILICLFHALRAFKREITTQKRRITKSQQDVSIAYLHCY